jgi:hypothetical protein
MADYRKKDAGGPCQIRVALGLGFLGQGQSCVRSCSPEGSLGMTPVQQGDEITPLVRRVVDPREGSLYLYSKVYFAKGCIIDAYCVYYRISSIL